MPETKQKSVLSENRADLHKTFSLSHDTSLNETFHDDPEAIHLSI
jgi:hypothetical protein